MSVSCGSVCLFVPLKNTCFQVDFWSKSVLLIMAYLERFLDFCCLDDFYNLILFFFRSLQVSILCIMWELPRVGSVTVAIGVIDK